MPVTPNNDPLGILAPEVSKDPLGILEKKSSILSVGSNGQLKSSVPTTSQSQPVPDFLKPKFNELAKGQMNVPDNGLPNPIEQEIEHKENVTKIPEVNKARAAYKEKVIKATPTAIENAAKRSLQLQGLDPSNKALLNQEKQKFATQIVTGNAEVGFDKEGNAGLIEKTSFLGNLHDHMMSAINDTKNAREFHKMTVPERVQFAKSLQHEEKPTAYIGSKPTPLGTVGAKGGDVLPTLGLYGAGGLAGGVLSGLAPETGGLSALALKPVMSFVMNEGFGANQKGMQGTLSRYNAIKKQYPDISDEEAMTRAGHGEDVDRLAGIAETALFSTVGGKLGKSATGSFLKGMAKAGVDVGAKTAAVEGLKDVAHNIEGVEHKSVSDITKDVAETFGENSAMGSILHGFMGAVSGISKVPGMIKSALKYDVVTKIPPEEINAALNENIKSGAITPDEAEKATNELGEFHIALNKVPEGLSPESQASVAGLILKRENLKKSAVGKDESANEIVNQQVESINNQIKEIYRTDKPLQHEINPATARTYEKPSFDNVAKQRVEDVADKISKGKRITDHEDLQTQANFPQELEKQLQRISKEETSANKDKVKPNTELSDNVEKYLNDKSKEAEKNKFLDPKEETGITGEGTNKVEQPTEIKTEQPKIIPEHTDAEIKDISKEPISIESIDAKVKIKDLETGETKTVKAFEARTELRKRLKTIEEIIKCI